MQSASKDGGGDDADDSSSSNSPLQTTNEAVNTNTVLDEFRQKWHDELHIDTTHQHRNTTTEVRHTLTLSESVNDDKNDENIATQLFMQGVESEHNGKVYDALSFYRRAVQIDPDIEYKVYEATVKNDRLIGKPAGNELARDDEDIAANTDDENLDGVDLYARFEAAVAKRGTVCEPIGEKGAVIITGTHLSALPLEIMLLVMRWVVSSDLDIRSLERCALVAKGFFMCARDPEIWHRACIRVWGTNTGQLIDSPFNSWRQMFINRHRVLFHGCYISKTSYLRFGENSFQDKFYRPVQLVEYYRYFRFFPDGIVLMMTSADDPNSCVTRLKSRYQTRKEIFKGRFCLQNDVVSIVMKPTPNQSTNRRNEEQKNKRTFYMEMNISNPKAHMKCKSNFGLLKWKRYTTTEENGQESITTEFDLNKRRYPPFYFSRVNSYYSESDYPLL